MAFRDTIKKILLKINPTYKKLTAVQQQVDVLKQQNANLQKTLSRIEGLIINNHNQTRTMLWWLQAEGPANERIAQKEFWSKYPKATGDMQIVQAGNMYILKSLKEICDAHGLKFWLHGGTLIGALRHNGCIPWDDDVDVAMMRSDIEKLLAILEDNDRFKLNIYYHDDHTFSRGYQFKLKNLEIPNFVDIFVFDYCSINSKQQELEHIRDFSTARGGMIKKFLALSPRPVAIDIGAWHWGPFKPDDVKRVDPLIDEGLSIMGNISEGNCIYYAIDNYPFPYPVIPIEDMFPMVKHEFEGCEYDIPANPDLYLKGYGDYWQAPRDIERAPHFDYYEPYVSKIKEFLEKNDFNSEV